MTRAPGAWLMGILLVPCGAVAPAGMSLVPGLAVAASAPDRSFTLTARYPDLARYYPTYLANGYWSLDSGPAGSAPAASQMMGLMEYGDGDVSRPATLPAWNEIDYFDGAQWLNAAPVRPASHQGYRQTLDMHDGELVTHFRWRSARHRSDVTVTSLVSQAAPHLAAVDLTLVPHFDGPVRLRFTLRARQPPARLPLARMNAAEFAAAAAAADRSDAAAGGKRDVLWYGGHVTVAGGGGDPDALTLWLDGKADGGRGMALAAAIALPRDLPGIARRVVDADGVIALEVDARVRRGRRYHITKFIAASAQGWGGDGAADVALASAAREAGYASLAATHEAAWHALWRSDILVGGSANLQRTLHSDLFYLLENTSSGTAWPAGACGFSGNYFGHVFWDNDLWVFPALLLMHPERARSLIAFRGTFLPQAKSRALAHGYAGAMYPWEADPATGVDVTPGFAVENADREIHVNGAVALAQWQYYLASGDRAWLERDGYPVIAAVADFWVSRTTWNAQRHRYELRDVTSPEEDYTHVDNEIYTNEVAHASLAAAAAAASTLGIAGNPRWRDVADRLYLPAAGRGPYDDFDPSTPHDKKNSWMATSVPMLSIPAVGFEADAATLDGLLRHSVAAVAGVRDRANQMILVMLAIQAVDAGNAGYFGDFIGAPGAAPDPFLKPPFNVRSETPQNDSTYLLATSGGFVQAFAWGLTGLRLDRGGLVERFPPHLPPSLTSLRLTGLTVRGRTAEVTLSRTRSGDVVRHVEFGTP